MKHSFLALAFQETASDNSMWIIIGVVLFLLVLVVVVVGVGLTIFFVMRKRSKAQRAAATSAVGASAFGSPSGYSPSVPLSVPEEAVSLPEAAVALDATPPLLEPPIPLEEIRADVAEAEPPTSSAPAADSGSLDFDPSRTVAINRESTVAISYGTIRFVSGALAGQEFDVKPEGSYIGREGSLSQIVVPDPRISKRHLWIGVRDGLVTIVDQESRNGTFVNDPKSERITEAKLDTGDTVILGESDVARFEYQM
jgi:hypothetical protein